MPLETEGIAFRIWMHCLHFEVKAKRSEVNAFRFWMQCIQFLKALPSEDLYEGNTFSFLMQCIHFLNTFALTNDYISVRNKPLITTSQVAQLAKAPDTKHEGGGFKSRSVHTIFFIKSSFYCLQFDFIFWRQCIHFLKAMHSKSEGMHSKSEDNAFIYWRF